MSATAAVLETVEVGMLVPHERATAERREN